MFAIRYENDPSLKEIAEPVTEFNAELHEIAMRMQQTMSAHNGYGLAAPQVGISKRIIVVSFEPYVLINPVIVGSSGKQKFREGCLSFPKLFLDIERANSVKVDYKNLKGDDVWTTASGLDAVCLQHEIDHLDGKVFTGKVKSIALLLARKNMK